MIVAEAKSLMPKPEPVSALRKKLKHLPVKPVFTSEEKNWKGFGVSRHLLPPGSYAARPYSDHYVAVQISNTVMMDADFNGQHHTGRFFKGDVSYSTPGVACSSHWEQERELLIVSLDDSFVARHRRNFLQPDALEQVPQFRTRDPLIEGIAHALGQEAVKNESKTSIAPDNHYAESLAEVLVAHLIKNYSAAVHTEAVSIGKLAPVSLRRATDFINDRLEGDIALADIADAVGMSPFHFARMFKQTTGHSPLQYVMEQKIERAKIFLRAGELPLVDIAFRLGFASQSHFTSHFRKMTGTTPRHFRGVA